MATKALLVVLALALIAVALAASLDVEEQLNENLSEALSLEDLEEYFTPIEKRGSKVGRESQFIIISHYF